MTDQNAPVTKHVGTVKEHLAGIAAARAWINDLAAAHLLRYQDPIRDQSIPDQQAPKS